MTVYETEVPGVGHKFELDLDGGQRLVVLIHHDGKRELYLRPAEDADSEKLFSLTGDTARKLGSILEGAYFQPVDLDDVTVPLGDAIIEWVEVDPDSALVDKTLEECRIREETGISVLAIQRDDETIPNPSADTRIRADDVLVSLGNREEQQALDELVTDA